MVTREGAIDAARIIGQARYPEAQVLFAAGSIVRGEGTPHSDLDLVVIYTTITAAFRESFVFDGLPVEAFVHDPETLHYFFVDVDRKSGVPSLPQMVVEAVEIPGPTDLSVALKAFAASILGDGPPQLTPDDVRKLRYAISDLVDDIRSPRSADDLTAAGARLFEELANYALRERDRWSARGKSIPRALAAADSALAERYSRAFAGLFERQDPAPVIALAEDLLRPAGGFLFDGYRLDAPREWRRRV